MIWYLVCVYMAAHFLLLVTSEIIAEVICLAINMPRRSDAIVQSDPDAPKDPNPYAVTWRPTHLD